MSKYGLLADKVRRLMDEQGLSATDLATRAHIEYESVRRLIYGYTKNPYAATLLAIARALGVSPYDLIDATGGRRSPRVSLSPREEADSAPAPQPGETERIRLDHLEKIALDTQAALLTLTEAVTKIAEAGQKQQGSKPDARRRKA